MAVVNTSQLTPAPGATPRQGRGQIVMPPPQGGGGSVSSAGSAGGIAPQQGSGIASGIAGAGQVIQRSIEKRADQKRQERMLGEERAFRQKQLKTEIDFRRDQAQAQQRFVQSQQLAADASLAHRGASDRMFDQLLKSMGNDLLNPEGVAQIFDSLKQENDLGLSSAQRDVGAMAAQAYVSGDPEQTRQAVSAGRDAHRAMLDPTQDARLPGGFLDWGTHNVIRSTNTINDVLRSLLQQEIRGKDRAGDLRDIGLEMNGRITDSVKRSTSMAYAMFGALPGSNRGIDAGIDALSVALADVINNNDTETMPFKTALLLAFGKAGLPNATATMNALDRGDAEATTAGIARGRGSREARVAYASALQGVGVTLDFLAGETELTAEIDMADGEVVTVSPSDQISKLAGSITNKRRLHKMRSELVALAMALDSTDDLGAHATVLRSKAYMSDLFDTIAGIEGFQQQRIREDEIDPIMQGVFERHPEYRNALEDEATIIRAALPALGQFSPTGPAEVANLSTEEFGGPFGGGPVIQNPDGSHSSERTMGIQEDEINNGRETLIPTIVDGVQLSPEEARQHALEVVRAGGQFRHHFDSVEEANAFAQQRSDRGGATTQGVLGRP